jgi:hypothetical protein
VRLGFELCREFSFQSELLRRLSGFFIRGYAQGKDSQTQMIKDEMINDEIDYTHIDIYTFNRRVKRSVACRVRL